MNKRSGSAFLRPVAIAALAITFGFSGGAHAVIDYGQTVASVTTQGDRAVIDAQIGVFDSAAGLQWIKSTTMEEGQAQGYRLATVDDFRSLMQNKGWTAASGVPDQWSLNSGFSYTTVFSVPGTYNEHSVRNLTSVSFNSDAKMPVPGKILVGGYLSATLGWLNGGDGGRVGAIFDQSDSMGYSRCGSSGCSSSSQDYYYHDAVVASLSDLRSGVYDSTSHATDKNWSGLMARLPQTAQDPSVMYFMVASVPEPSSYALVVLGLLGVGVVARRTGRAQPRLA